MLVSTVSGLAMLLREVLPGDLVDQLVVPVTDDPARDVPRWGHAIAVVLRDRAGAFRTAAAVREIMARERTWSGATAIVLEAGAPNRSCPRQPAGGVREGSGDRRRHGHGTYVEHGRADRARRVAEHRCQSGVTVSSFAGDGGQSVPDAGGFPVVE